MKNILNEKPDTNLKGISKYIINFVDDRDIFKKRVLDIGCGFGWFELNAVKRGVRVIEAIEISDNDLVTARRHIKNKKVNFRAGGALNLPYKDNFFDTVVAWDVIEHIPRNTEDKMFKEIDRVLKNGGSFYLSTPFDNFFSKLSDPAFLLIGHRHYSKKRLIDFGKNVQFEIEKAEIKGGKWNLLFYLNMYISKWVFRRTPLFEKSIRKREEKEFSATREGFMSIFMRYKKI